MLRHFNPKAMKVHIFHGSGKIADLEVLWNSDLILTTYATLAVDHKKPGPLHDVELYRVVLDEGK